MSDTKWMFDAELEFYANQHWLNPFLNVVCRVLRWNYFWTTRYGRRRLHIGNANSTRPWFVL